MNPPLLRFDARAIADGTGLCASPGSVLVELPPSPGAARATLLAAGPAAEVDRHPGSRNATRIALPTSLLIPGLVNAHTHLDLTHIGPQPHDADAGFLAWVDMIRARRLHEEAQIAASVRRGIALSIAGGTVAVGDIAGAPGGRPSIVPWRTLGESPLQGVSFLEFFSIGTRREQGLAACESVLRDALREPAPPGGVRLGLQPHAPTTVSVRSYHHAAALAARHALPLATHLAETPEEREFLAHAAGPQRGFLERLGLWEDSILEEVGHGRDPVLHLRPVLERARFLVAHVNEADDAAIRTLAATGTSVAYCPRASDYFGAPRYFGPHRYRDMLDAGVNVALGTDSIVNLPDAAASPETGMSILDEVRLLYTRDQVDPIALLRMATLNGAAALGLDAAPFAFANSGKPTPLAGLIAIDIPETPSARPHDHLRAALLASSRPRLLVGADGSYPARNPAVSAEQSL